jgi:hypothetical protein
MKKSHFLGSLCTGVLTLIATTSQADLVGVLPTTPGGTDYQAYYDTDANLTWRANANGNGPMTWDESMSWVAGLNIDGVTGWRLPTTLDPDPACDQSDEWYHFNCTGSELGNLFYNVLGNTENTGLSNVNAGPFSDVWIAYWSSTENVRNDEEAWLFVFNGGMQQPDPKWEEFHAWAVHDGNPYQDVNPNAVVPLPAAVWLFGSGLLGLIGIARSRDAA